ncbi:hypothetical protein [Agarilytica rhodophyticola]|uniref:chorismate transformation enzyme, FkbO/Hyg5 family n=1 Tax=Agarilytica rhodophyticola TaxID=1737490 RepID=UPI000B3492AB|nr:hypothetical protein [Agarilytica rhodophyticola]
MFRQYYSTKTPEELLDQAGVLSVVSFNTQCQASATPGIIPIGVDSLCGHASEVIECGSGTVKRGITGDCQWSHNDDVMCAATWIDGKEFDDLEAAAEKAYLTILEQLRALDYCYPFRFWNFIADINLGESERERYKKFCTGRLNAFTKLGFSSDVFPAASAVGHHKQGAAIYVLASKAPGVHHENPRQQSAYHYPKQYGISSPSFSRATSIDIGNKKLVFISGTASILGHETRAPGDINEQLQLTVSNIDHLIAHINLKPSEYYGTRVYLRNKKDLNIAQKFLADKLSGDNVTYTFADICRSNLEVEIETAFEVLEN